MHPDVYTPAAIQSYIFSSNIRAFVTIVFAFFCIFAILRYSARSMEAGYRFHLLNMSICILLSDISICVLVRPYSLLPLSGACMVGELNDFLLSRMKLIDMLYTKLVSFLKALNLAVFVKIDLKWCCHGAIFVGFFLHNFSLPKK
jgi:uncharacterized membrane protein